MLYKIRAFHVLLAITLTLGTAHVVYGQITDTLEARRLAVARYLQLVPMKTVMDETIQEVAKGLQSPQRENFLVYGKKLDLAPIEKAASESLSKHFTLGEIRTLVAFMELPEGQSAMRKMKFYMADLMPVIQAEMRKALEATNR